MVLIWFSFSLPLSFPFTCRLLLSFSSFSLVPAPLIVARIARLLARFVLVLLRRNRTRLLLPIWTPIYQTHFPKLPHCQILKKRKTNENGSACLPSLCQVYTKSTHRQHSNTQQFSNRDLQTTFTHLPIPLLGILLRFPPHRVRALVARHFSTLGLGLGWKPFLEIQS